MGLAGAICTHGSTYASVDSISVAGGATVCACKLCPFVKACKGSRHEPGIPMTSTVWPASVRLFTIHALVSQCGLLEFTIGVMRRDSRVHVLWAICHDGFMICGAYSGMSMRKCKLYLLDVSSCCLKYARPSAEYPGM